MVKESKETKESMLQATFHIQDVSVDVHRSTEEAVDGYVEGIVSLPLSSLHHRYHFVQLTHTVLQLVYFNFSQREKSNWY